MAPRTNQGWNTALFTPGQNAFIATLSQSIGLNPGVIAAQVYNEENGHYATQREASGNHNWLNIGITDSRSYGANNSVWSNPVTAAKATAAWWKGTWSDPGFGRASSGIRHILDYAGQPPAQQISALQNSGWASGRYPALPSIYNNVTGGFPGVGQVGPSTDIPTTPYGPGSPGFGTPFGQAVAQGGSMGTTQTPPPGTLATPWQAAIYAHTGVVVGPHNATPNIVPKVVLPKAGKKTPQWLIDYLKALNTPDYTPPSGAGGTTVDPNAAINAITAGVNTDLGNATVTPQTITAQQYTPQQNPAPQSYTPQQFIPQQNPAPATVPYGPAYHGTQFTYTPIKATQIPVPGVDTAGYNKAMNAIGKDIALLQGESAEILKQNPVDQKTLLDFLPVAAALESQITAPALKALENQGLAAQQSIETYNRGAQQELQQIPNQIAANYGQAENLQAGISQGIQQALQAQNPAAAQAALGIDPQQMAAISQQAGTTFDQGGTVLGGAGMLGVSGLAAQEATQKSFAQTLPGLLAIAAQQQLAGVRNTTQTNIAALESKAQDNALSIANQMYSGHQADERLAVQRQNQILGQLGKSIGLDQSQIKTLTSTYNTQVSQRASAQRFNAARIQDANKTNAAGFTAAKNETAKSKTDAIDKTIAAHAAVDKINTGATNKTNQANVGIVNKANALNVGAKNTAGQINTAAVNKTNQGNVGIVNTANAANAGKIQDAASKNASLAAQAVSQTQSAKRLALERGRYLINVYKATHPQASASATAAHSKEVDAFFKSRAGLGKPTGSQPIYKLNPDGTQATDVTGKPIKIGSRPSHADQSTYSQALAQWVATHPGETVDQAAVYADVYWNYGWGGDATSSTTYDNTSRPFDLRMQHALLDAKLEPSPSWDPGAKWYGSPTGAPYLSPSQVTTLAKAGYASWTKTLDERYVKVGDQHEYRFYIPKIKA